MNTRRYIALVAALIRTHGFTPPTKPNPTWEKAKHHSKWGGLTITTEDLELAAEALDFFDSRFFKTARLPFLFSLTFTARQTTLLDSHLETAAWILPTYLEAMPAKVRPNYAHIS